MNPEELYVNLGRLVANPPTLYARRIGGDAQIWLGRAYALVAAVGVPLDAARLIIHTESLSREGDSTVARQVMDILYRALAVAEMRAPAQSRGAFINAGSSFDAMIAVGKVLSTAKTRLLIVDPYMDEKALTDFAVLAPEGVGMRLLTDSATIKSSLQPAASRWTSQYGARRPLEVRLARPKTLHDRLIVVDDSTVWTLTQSLNAFAARSPASIIRVDGDAGVLKRDAYEQFWLEAKPLA